MPRILGLDYGMKRCGLATTDPLQIICTAIDTFPTDKLMAFLEIYCKKEEVEKLVIGKPEQRDGEPTYLEGPIQEFIQVFSKKFPSIEIARQDEAYTSKIASNILFQSGIGKKRRQEKELVDKVSAVVILQNYLGHY